MHRIPVFAFLLSLVGGGILSQVPRPQCADNGTHARQGAHLLELLDSLHRAYPSVPGLSLAAIGPGGCLQWAGAVGVADRTSGAPLTPGHTHRIASNTKTYTAAAALRLMEDGRLTLDDPLTRHVAPAHLASLRRDGYAVDAITVRHLLTHTAGIYDYAMDPRYIASVEAQPTHRWTRSSQVDSAVAWGEPYGPPGTTFHYTDTGYILLAEIVEQVSGMPLAQAFRRLLSFERLGLKATWLESLEEQPPTAGPRAHQYMGALDTYAFDPSLDLYGGGGLAATPMDMARFTRALLTDGVFRRSATLQLMLTTTGSTAPRMYAAGLSGVRIGDVAGWGHTGFWNTFSYHFPSKDVTIAASATEQGNGAVSRALLQGAARLLFLP
jgi:D-alanyl-D-alanine carboxypeptidase